MNWTMKKFYFFFYLANVSFLCLSSDKFLVVACGVHMRFTGPNLSLNVIEWCHCGLLGMQWAWELCINM